MDDADYAQAATDLEITVALQKREHELPDVGACNWCDAIIVKGLFCDADCRDDYQKSKVMKG